jgi:poly(A)-specific ribonuclease
VKDKIEEEVGFRRVVELLINSKKPLLGHNCNLDLIHLIDKFYSPVPKDYEKYKKLLHQAFPLIIDTKYLSSLPELKVSLEKKKV